MIGLRYALIWSAALVFAAPVTAATNPWFGTWHLKTHGPAEPPETLIYSDAGNGAMRMESIEEGSVIVTRFDGRPARDTGAPPSSGHALAIEAIDAGTYAWTFLKDGKPYVRGVNKLAADRRSFQETSWRVTGPRRTVTLIYERR